MHYRNNPDPNQGPTAQTGAQPAAAETLGRETLGQLGDPDIQSNHPGARYRPQRVIDHGMGVVIAHQHRSATP